MESALKKVPAVRGSFYYMSVAEIKQAVENLTADDRCCSIVKGSATRPPFFVHGSRVLPGSMRWSARSRAMWRVIEPVNWQVQEWQ